MRARSPTVPETNVTRDQDRSPRPPGRPARRAGRDQAPWGSEPHPNTPRSAPPVSDVWLNIVMVVVFVLIGGVLLRRGDRADLAARVPGPGPVRDRAAAARRCSGCWPTPTASSPPCRSASPWPLFSASAFGAEHAVRAARRLRSSAGAEPGPGRTAGASSCVTVAISYLSLVLGELTPKRLALQRAEGLAMLVAPVAQRDRQALPADRLAAVGVDRTRWSGCSAATRRSAASRSARRSCGTSSPRTSR